MILYKMWEKPIKECNNKRYRMEGWFLFDIIPLYTRRYGIVRDY